MCMVMVCVDYGNVGCEVDVVVVFYVLEQCVFGVFGVVVGYYINVVWCSGQVVGILLGVLLWCVLWILGVYGGCVCWVKKEVM